MTIATTLAALQTIHAAITGVASAPTDKPSNTDRIRHPFVLVWPDAAEWHLQAIDLRRQQRTYIVRCYVQPAAQGLAGIDAGYDTCVTLLEHFGRAYLADTTLGGAVDHIESITDMGVSGGSYELTWAQVSWWGFEYRIVVVEKSTD
jgi:hypothetical protein